MSGANPVAQAIGGLGRAVGQTGDLMVQLEEEQERQYLTDAELVMGRESARIAADLAMNMDPLKHTEIANGRLQSVKEKILGNENLSPSMYKSLEERIDAYSNAKLEKISVDAKLMQLENGKSLQLAKASYYKDEGRHDDAERAITEGVGIYYPPETAEILLMNLSRDKEKNDTDREIFADPAGWIKRNPKPGADVNKWTANQRAAKSRQADLVNEDQARVLEALANRVVQADEIEGLTPNMSDSERAKVAEFVDDKYNDDYQKVVRSPGYQATLTGSILSKINDFDPIEDRGTAKESSLYRDLDQVVDPRRKKQLEKSLSDLIGGLEATQKTNYDSGLAQINTYVSQVELNIAKPPVETEDRSVLSHLQDGFFNDPEKLKAIGLSDDHIDEIRKLGSVDAQAGYLKEIWDERPNQVYASPDALKLAEATVKEGGSLGAIFSSKDQLNVEASEAYHRKINSLNADRGKLVDYYSRWADQNPAATYDDHIKKSREIAQEFREQQARGTKIPSAASSQSASAWRTNIKMSNFGYPGDHTPDSNSENSIGHADNIMRDGQSAAITRSLAVKLGLKRGAVIELQTTEGRMIVTYDNTVPTDDERTGPLPETIDIFRKSNGSNGWGGRVQGVKLILQGRDGISGRAYSKFSSQNYQKALNLIQE